MVENFTDPAHLPFTHKDSIGRFTKPTLITCSINYDVLSGTTKKGEKPVIGDGDGDNDDRNYVPHYLSKDWPAVEGLFNFPEHPAEFNRKYSQPVAFIAPCCVRLTLRAPSKH
jgi:hypothetical protein